MLLWYKYQCIKDQLKDGDSNIEPGKEREVAGPLILEMTGD